MEDTIMVDSPGGRSGGATDAAKPSLQVLEILESIKDLLSAD